MNVSRKLRPFALSVVVLFCGACDLFNTTDSEDISGRGPLAFDPYSGSRSGAIRLALQHFNGCSILVTGEPVGKGSLGIDYPSQCPSMLQPDPNASKVAATGTMKLLKDTPYFLGQLTLMDTVVNKHTQYPNPAPALKWLAEESRFKNLDWAGAGVAQSPFEDYGTAGDFVDHRFYFGGAAWMKNREDSFLVEALDATLTVRRSVVYSRSEFLAEAAEAGHTQYSWRVENLSPPKFPGDSTIHNTQFQPTFRTTFRQDLVVSANPFKNFSIPFAGEGLIRVSWSQLPNEPFYFPIQVLEARELEPTCFTEDDQPAPCSFGLDIRVALSPPANGGTHYEPGETLVARWDLRDEEGARLHRKLELPSYKEFFAQQSNGIAYFLIPHGRTLLERDILPVYMVAGPLHKMKLPASAGDPLPYTTIPKIDPTTNVGAPIGAGPLVAGSEGFLDGMQEMTFPTQQTLPLPADAEPGTYALMVKLQRQWMGERVGRLKTVYFQVGTDTKTKYPNRVGNCQICHRGVLSLDNVRHGASVDDVESCKACHSNPKAYFKRSIHQLHNNSPKYPFRMNDCTVCHLTRESATTPSLATCSSCHPRPHGSEFFNLEFVPVDQQPNRFTTCAESCHVGGDSHRTPTAHILPE